MAVDWQRSRNTVERMIKQYGRPITIINDVGPVDDDDPLGPAGQPVSQSVMGVFVRPSGYIKLGESFLMDPGMWPDAEKIVLVLPSLTYNFEKFTRVEDTDGSGYKIFKVESLTPGPVPILLYLGLRQ